MFSYSIKERTRGAHPTVVWSEDGDVRSKNRLVVACVFRTGCDGIGMRLEKRNTQVADKPHGKRGIAVSGEDAPKECFVRGFSIRQHPQPFMLVFFPQRKPLVQLVQGNAEFLAEPFNGTQFSEIFAKESEDEEQTVGGVRDDAVRKDCVGMIAAVTEDPHDAEFILFRMSVSEINDRPAVIIMDVTVSGGTTDGAGLQFRLKLIHVSFKEIF